MMGRVPPAYVPEKPLSPQPWARRPSSGEQLRLEEAFEYQFQEKGIDYRRYRKLLKERIFDVIFKDWESLVKKFDFLVDAILKGDARNLPPIWIWKGVPPPALMGTETSAWRTNREEQKADAICHFVSVLIRNARNKIGVVPTIDDLRKHLEEAGISGVLYADINEAINQAYERRDPWFAGISLRELNEFLET
ncbi:unnamed protein product [marine sediment metagenome]|uniref:Uncharacterized protein n=1 Tax=marine sediment metagenome TaxID=412755 RepID=X0YL06_9ZZZZ